MALRPSLPVVVVTAFGTLDRAIAAMRAGAHDFLNKPFDVEELAVRLEHAIAHRGLREEVARLRSELSRSSRYGELIGSSEPMRKLYDLLDRIRDSEASVLLTGETGTGKEVVARAIHERSRRVEGPFVAINCAAMPESLLESELFGHVKGAFTDARSARRGLFLQASGGTLFLDEIGELPQGLQAKLLRALQERRVRAVGSDVETPFDARLVAATHRDLDDALAEGTFREDLYYRIKVLEVPLPPLRARGNDVLTLADHFVRRFAAAAAKGVAGIDAAAAARLLVYTWPGNVRELANAMEAAVALTRADRITLDDLPEKIRRFERTHVVVESDDPGELLPMEEVERRYIQRVLDAVGGNKTTAAQILRLDRKTLYNKLDRWSRTS
ncbi:MAG: sigma-54-dependent Fis family transcriptional regulator [Deltaproteobacteria bacterium]|nr:sigma-54-dependent Fis family transcriptional regulator [Deltaproteobacteria bacterium]